MFLSIIIPVYNTPVKFLAECLESLKELPLQFEIEVIIVNDGSMDVETLNYLSALDEIKYTIINKKNGGLSSARNVGIKVAKGKFIFPLDSDDVLSENFTLFINYLVEDSKIDILYGDFLYFGDVNKVEKKYRFSKIGLWFDSGLPACSFFKKSVWSDIGGYDEKLKTFEDYDFWIRSSIKGFNFMYLNTHAFKYRKINDGVSLYQNTRMLHKSYSKYLRNKIPINKIKLLGIVFFMKVFY